MGSVDLESVKNYYVAMVRVGEQEVLKMRLHSIP